MTVYGEYKRRYLRSMAAWLRKEFPPKRPVVLHFRRAYDHERKSYTSMFGYCSWSSKKKRWVIVISEGIMSLQLGIDTLMHEWAHALAPGDIDTAHHDSWSRAYGRIYRAFYDGDEEGRKLVRAMARRMKKTNRARKIRRKARRS